MNLTRLETVRMFRGVKLTYANLRFLAEHQFNHIVLNKHIVWNEKGIWDISDMRNVFEHKRMVRKDIVDYFDSRRIVNKYISGVLDDLEYGLMIRENFIQVDKLHYMNKFVTGLVPVGTIKTSKANTGLDSDEYFFVIEHEPKMFAIIDDKREFFRIERNIFAKLFPERVKGGF